MAEGGKVRVFCFSVLLCTALCGFLPSAASAHHASTGRRRFARTLNIVLPSSHEGMSRGLDVPEGFRAFDLSAPAGKRNRSVLSFVGCPFVSLSLSLIVSALCMYVCDACFVLVPPPYPPDCLLLTQWQQHALRLFQTQWHPVAPSLRVTRTWGAGVVLCTLLATRFPVPLLCPLLRVPLQC